MPQSEDDHDLVVKIIQSHGDREEVGPWLLEPESAAWAKALKQAMPRPLHTLGVAGARDISVSGDLGDLPQVEEVVVVEIPTSQGSVRARIYRPKSDGLLPIALYLHGGGWALGSLDAGERLCRDLCIAASCVVVSLDYPLAPENPFPIAVESAFDVLKWIESRPHAISSLGGDSGRIGVIGDSAGGNLAAALTVMSRDRHGPHLAGQVLIYPITTHDAELVAHARFPASPLLAADDIEWFWQLYGSPADPSDSRAFPGNADLRGLPPALVILAEVDALYEDGLRYARRLERANVEVSVIVYEGTFHGFFPRPATSPAAVDAIRRAAEHLSNSFSLT